MFGRSVNLFQLAWVLRFLVYRVTYRLKGDFVSYLAKPIYHNGLKRLEVEGSLGIFPNWRLEFLGQGRMYVKGRVRVGHNFHAIVGGNICLSDNVVIGPDVYISSYETSLLEFVNSPVAERPVDQSPVVIEDNVFIGKGSVIFPGVTIGKDSVIGAYSVVKTSVPEKSVVRSGNVTLVTELKK